MTRRRPGIIEHKMVSPKSIVVCTRRGGRVEPDFSFGIPEDILQMLSDLYSARTPEEIEAVRDKKAPVRTLTR